MAFMNRSKFGSKFLHVLLGNIMIKTKPAFFILIAKLISLYKGKDSDDTLLDT